MNKIVEFFRRIISPKKTQGVVEIIAEDCMISRANIPAIYIDSDNDEAQAIWKKTKSRFLLMCDDGLDDIIGVLDIFNYSFDKSIGKQKLFKPIFLAPNTELKTFYGDLIDQRHLHVVVDEFGGTKGVVTLESTMAYIFSTFQQNKMTLHSEMVIDGKMPLKNFLQITDLQINLEEYDSKTINGFIMEYLGKIPKLHEVFQIDNVEFTITNITDRQLSGIKIKILK